MRTQHRSAWLLFGLLMCGCLSGPSIPPYPQTVDITAPALRTLPVGTGPEATTVERHLEHGPVLLVLREHDAHSWGRTERMIADTLSSFPDDNRLRVVEIVLEDEDRPERLSTVTTDRRWTRTPADASTTRRIEGRVADTAFSSTPVYLVTGHAGARAVYPYREGLGRVYDLLASLPVSDALEGRTYASVVDEFGAPTRVNNNLLGRGVTQWAYRYTNVHTSHDARTTLTVRRGVVTSAHTARTHNNPAIVTRSGDNGTMYAVEDLVRASCDPESTRGAFGDTTAAELAWFDLVRTDHPGIFRATTTPEWRVDPGEYRLMLHLRYPAQEHGLIGVSLKRGVTLRAGARVHLDICALVRASTGAPAE